MNFRGLLALVALAGVLAQHGVARANISYTYVTDSSTYSAAAGASVTVQIFLNENLTGSSTSLESANNGMVGAGYYVTKSSGDASAKITATSGNANNFNTTNPAAGDGFGSGESVSKQVATDGSAARLLEGVNATTGPVGVATTFGRQLLLGTVVITAGNAGTSTTYTLETYKNAPTSLGGSGVDGNTLDFSGNDYDVTGTDPTTGQQYTGANDITAITFTVTAVPEPSSILLCGLGACGLAWGAYRRYKAGRSLVARLA
jgi:hypothetical protein